MKIIKNKKKKAVSHRKAFLIIFIVLLMGIPILSLRPWNRTKDLAIHLPVSEIPFPKVGSIAREFILEDLIESEEVSLSELRGNRAAFINFWASWSPFSLDEMRDLAYIQEEFSESIVVIGINRAENKKIAESYSQKVGAYDAYPLLLDSSDRVWKIYRGLTMPTSFFIDREGVVREIKLGPLTLEEMRERVMKVISY